MRPVRKQRSDISYHPHHPTYQHFRRDHWCEFDSCIHHPRCSETTHDTADSRGYDGLDSTDVDAFKTALYDGHQDHPPHEQDNSDTACETSPVGCLGALGTVWMSLLRALATGSHKPESSY